MGREKPPAGLGTRIRQWFQGSTTSSQPQLTDRGRPRASYDGATTGRRAGGWKRNSLDANAELTPRVISALRDIARQMVRNNPHAESAVRNLATDMVGAGITLQIKQDGRRSKALTARAALHLDSTKIDPAGKLTLGGIQHLVARAIVTSGAVIIRRRWRRASDHLPLPFQLQVLEADYLDTSKHGAISGQPGPAIRGVQFGALGEIKGYWLYSGHPGSGSFGALESKLIPAADIAHIYRVDRPEQALGVTWFAPVILRMNDFGDYEDAQLVRQKLAACFTAFRIGGEDNDPPITDVGEDGAFEEADPRLETLEPGLIEDLPPGSDVKFANPPGVEGYRDYSSVSLHAIAAGIGVPYETITGDYSEVSFISGRLGRMQHRANVETWQWHMLIPQLCDRIGEWTLEAMEMAGEDVRGCTVTHTPPPFPLMDPATEVPADRDAVRAGQKTPSQVIRERGLEPAEFFEEYRDDMRQLDELGIILDCDPRKVSQVGNAVQINSPIRDAKPKGKA